MSEFQAIIMFEENKKIKFFINQQLKNNKKKNTENINP